jgi:hypothetical protein
MLIQQGMQPYYDLSQDAGVERLEKIGFTYPLRITIEFAEMKTKSAQVSGTRMHHE